MTPGDGAWYGPQPGALSLVAPSQGRPVRRPVVRRAPSLPAPGLVAGCLPHLSAASRGEGAASGGACWAGALLALWTSGPVERVCGREVSSLPR